MPDNTRRPRLAVRRASAGRIRSTGQDRDLILPSVQPSIPSRGLQRRSIDLNRGHLRNAEAHPRQREAPGAGTDIEHPGGRPVRARRVDGLQAEHRGRVKPGAERRPVGQPDAGRIGRRISGDEHEPPGSNGPRPQRPHRAVVPAGRGGDGHRCRGEDPRDRRRLDGIGKQRGDRRAAHLQVQRAEVNQQVGGAGRRADEIDPVRHHGALRVPIAAGRAAGEVARDAVPHVAARPLLQPLAIGPGGLQVA